MRSIAPNLVLIAIATSASLAVTIWIQDAVAAPRHQEMSEDFQRLVGGLGFGPALDLSRGAESFDPRQNGDADQALPGAIQDGSDDPFSIFRYPRLKRASGLDGSEN